MKFSKMKPVLSFPGKQFSFPTDSMLMMIGQKIIIQHNWLVLKFSAAIPYYYSVVNYLITSHCEELLTHINLFGTF